MKGKKPPINVFTEDIFADDSLYIKTKETDDRDYYFIPSMNKYMGVGKGKFRGYYCRLCKKFIDESEVIAVGNGVFGHYAKAESKRYNPKTGKMEKMKLRHLIKGGSMMMVCSVHACPVCGRPGMDTDNPGYCSEFHHKLMLDRLTKIMLKTDDDDPNQKSEEPNEIEG